MKRKQYKNNQHLSQYDSVKIYFDLLVEILNLVKAKGPRSERCNLRKHVTKS